jgi:rare lipoprotein A
LAARAGEKHKEQGIASWYGEEFHGRKTSSGEVYDMFALTAAHRTLPLGTRVRVTNLGNRRQIIVRINDRGPFVKERIIDLSYRAAKAIAMVGPGTAPVEIISLGNVRTGGEFTIQVGAFEEKAHALALLQRLAKHYKNTYISVYKMSDTTLYRVRVARCKTIRKAKVIEKELIQNDYPWAIIVSR